MISIIIVWGDWGDGLVDSVLSLELVASVPTTEPPAFNVRLANKWIKWNESLWCRYLLSVYNPEEILHVAHGSN